MEQADESKPPSFCLALAVSTHTEEYQRLVAEHVILSVFQRSLKLQCGSGKTELTTYSQTLNSFFQM